MANQLDHGTDDALTLCASGERWHQGSAWKRNRMIEAGDAGIRWRGAGALHGRSHLDFSKSRMLRDRVRDDHVSILTL